MTVLPRSSFDPPSRRHAQAKAGPLSQTPAKPPRPSILGRSAFPLLGVAGLFASIALTQVLALFTGRSSWVMLVITAVAVGTFLGLALVTKAISGTERLVNYHQQIAVLLVTAGVTALLGEPVLAYLDLTVLGLGTFLVFGRLGCLLAGCCHGRPHRWGMQYGDQPGFDPRFAGSRLFPTQLAEAVVCFGVVCAGIVMVLNGAPFLASYLIAYSLGRFVVEFFRGDARPYKGGFSEAQWTALTLSMLVAAAEFAGLLPLYIWHLTVAFGIAASMAVTAVQRRSTRTTPARHQLLNAEHVRELAVVLSQLRPGTSLAHTSAGLTLSKGDIPGGIHYTVSGLDHRAARTLFGLIRELRHPGVPATHVPGTPGTHHLLLDLSTSVEAALLPKAVL